MSAVDLLCKLNKPTPRYTSYPTAPEWRSLASSLYQEKLICQGENPLSLYVHIPFCKTMCLYCGCSVVLNRKEENEARYVDYLIKEIDLVASMLGKRKAVCDLHFGGGTPTKLSIKLFAKLFEKISSTFDLERAEQIAIEIDPRTVMENGAEKLHFLKTLGFNRVSFGVQDTDPKVQEAVKRRQTLEMTQQCYARARELGFQGINIDLIYGLPYQSPQSFDVTLSHILQMLPDRIALFSYAHVPWLKPHQKALPQHALPSTEEKFQIYANARRAFVEKGYVAIGMDHFACKEDEMAIAYRTKRLQRNFQGYSTQLADECLGFGITAIGFLQNTYVQNVKELKTYYNMLDQQIVPIERGLELSSEDILRKWVIHTLMCHFELDKGAFQVRFGYAFDTHFQEAQELLAQHEADGLLLNTPQKLLITPQGELFIRSIASCFDAYLKKPCPSPKFSQAV